LKTMGSQWSMGVVREVWRNLMAMDMDEINAKWSLWMKTAAAEYDNPGILMTYEHFRKVFNLSKSKGHVLFEYFESEDGLRQATAAEVFGALVLLSKVDINQKIQFMFNAMDRNYDRHINRTELYMAMLLSTRGVARLKRIAPPPLELLHELVGDAFGHEEVQLNSDGEIFNKDVIMWCKADDSVREYLIGLTQQKSTDIAGLYRQQEKILLKLAQLDGRMYDMAQNQAEDTEDARASKAERGGDARDGLIVEMHVDDDDLDKFEGDNIEVAHLDQIGPKKTKQRRHGQMLGMSFEVQKERSPAEVAQEQRRSKRRFDTMLEANEASGGDKTKDAGAFKINYRRVQGTGSVNKVVASDPLVEHEKLIKNSWDQIVSANSEDGYMDLDLDTFLDIIEATGTLLPDAEAMAALDAMRRNQLGQMNIGAILHFWRERDRKLKVEDPPEWQKRVMIARDHLRNRLSRWFAMKNIFDRQSMWVRDEQNVDFHGAPGLPVLNPEEGAQVALGKAEAAAKAAEDAGDPAFIASTTAALKTARAAIAIGKGATAGAEPEVEAAYEEPRVAHVGIAATIGHMIAPKGQVMLAILGAGLDAPGAAQPKRGEGGDITKFDITASEMLTFYSRSLPKTAPESRHMQTVLWIDFIPDGNASDYWIKQTTWQLEKAFRSIPGDFTTEFFDHVEAKMLTAGLKKPEHLVRLAFFKREDLIGDLEKAAFGDDTSAFTGVISRLSAIFDSSANSMDILTVAEQYQNLSQKCYGPQANELEELAEPIRFAKLMRERRAAAEKYNETAKTLTTKQLKTILMEHGYRDRGTRADMVVRVQKIMRVKMQLLGFGELSRFGETVARNVFRRCDDDDDRALNFVEFTKMNRMLGMLPQTGEGEYANSVQELGFASNRKGHLKEEGLVAYYEKHGRLAEDAAKCGIGSIDEVCSGMLSITADVDAKAMLALEPKWELSRFVDGLPKALAAVFLGGKDFFSEMEFERISDVLRWGQAGPTEWVTEPGGLLRRIYDVQEWLADGHAGAIVDLRHAMMDVFGDEWKSSKKADWPVQQAVKVDKKKRGKRSGRRPRRGRRKSRGDDGSISARSGDGTDAPITGRSGKSDASGGASDADGEPLTSRSGATTRRSVATSVKSRLTAAQSEESPSEAPVTARSGISDAVSEKSGKSVVSGINEENSAEDDESSFAWLEMDIGLPTGYISEIENSRKEVFRIRTALGLKMSKRERADMDDMLAAKIKAVKEMEERLKRASDLSVAHFLRAYDALRSILREVRRVQFGNSRVTFRGGMEGFQFLQFLPPGLGEAAHRREETEKRVKIAKERVDQANAFIKEERKRRRNQKEAAVLKALEERAVQKRLWDDEERFLYISGQRNRRGGIYDVAEEKWRKVMTVVEKRRGPTATSAVAQMNMAILLYENHQNDVTKWMECRSLMTSSLRTFDQYMKRAKNRRNGIDDQPGRVDNSDSEDEVEDERLRVKEEDPPDDVDMKVVRALLLNSILFLTLELDELETEARRIEQAEREAAAEDEASSDYDDSSSSKEEEETREDEVNKMDPLVVHPQVRALGACILVVTV
jgi:hypothetical protein